MKHNQRSASPGELACPHLSDHPTQEAKQQSNSDHGRSVVCSDRRPAAAFLTLNSSFCLFAVRASFQEHTLNTVRHNGNTIKTQSRHSQKHNGNTIKPQQNTINTVKTHSFFPGGPNVDSLSEVAQASCLPVQRLPASSTQPSTLNPEFSQPINCRSGCSAYRFEKNLALSLQPSALPFDLRQTLDFPTQNAFPKLNLAAIFSLHPLASSVCLEPFVTTFRKANNSCWAPDSWRAGQPISRIPWFQKLTLMQRRPRQHPLLGERKQVRACVLSTLARPLISRRKTHFPS